MIKLVSFFFFSICLLSLHAQDPIEHEMNTMMYKGGFQQQSLQYGKLKEHEAMFRDFQLLAENEYIVVAYGEKGVIDVDIQFLDRKNEELAKDKDAESLAMVSYSPATTQYVKVIISNYNSESRNHSYVVKYIVYTRPKTKD